MVRQVSGYVMKQSQAGKTYRTMNVVPKEGTLLRQCWDLLKANPGVEVKWNHGQMRGWNEIQQLVDYYGLDVRKSRPNRGAGNGGWWILIGEYMNRGEYVGYVESSLPEIN